LVHDPRTWEETGDMHLVPHISPSKATIALVVAIVGALALAVSALATGSHGAGLNTGRETSNVPTIAAACAGTHIWAVVNADGTLARAGGACAGTTSSGSGGAFDVIFPKNIVNCAYVATIGSPDRSGTLPAGTVTVVGAAISKNGVFVETWNSSGTLTPMPFHLVVDC
jgi:hypothetical protein